MENGFAKLLADNDQVIRDKAIGTLKKWLKQEQSKLDYKEYLKLWKGLFFCMWMADKPKYQHELAERLSGIAKGLSLECPEEPEEETDEPESLSSILPPALLYLHAFWETICREWKGIDRLRLNKYYYLMKQMMRAGFELVEAAGFEQDMTCIYFSVLGEFPLNMENEKISAGVKIFFIENYVETLGWLEEKFDASMTMILFTPLFEALVSCKDKIITKALTEALTAVIPASNDEEENQFDFGFFAQALFDLGADPEVKDSSRKALYALSEKFKPFMIEMEDDDCCGGCGDDECGHVHDDDHEEDSDEESGSEGESCSEEESGSEDEEEN